MTGMEKMTLNHTSFTPQAYTYTWTDTNHKLPVTLHACEEVMRNRPNHSKIIVIFIIYNKWDINEHTPYELVLGVLESNAKLVVQHGSLIKDFAPQCDLFFKETICFWISHLKPLRMTLLFIRIFCVVCGDSFLQPQNSTYLIVSGGSYSKDNPTAGFHY